jgi:hypothetical protein
VSPLLIYVGAVLVLVAASVATWIWRQSASRVCPLCEARVELGRTRCQVCGYRFSTARY